MRLNIYTIFILGIILLGFLWFLGNVEAAKIEERWSVNSDSITGTAGDTRDSYVYDSQEDVVKIDEEGNGVDMDDPVVDDQVVETEATFKIAVTVKAYKIVYKEAYWYRGIGFKPPVALPENLCGEYEDDYIRVTLVKEQTLDIQSIIESGQKVEDVTAGVKICMSVDFIEVPENLGYIKIYINDAEVKPSIYGETYILTIPAGKQYTKTFEVKAIYSLDDGIERTHIFKNKVEINVEWKPEKTFEVGFKGKDLVSWCIDEYSDLVGKPLSPYKSVSDLTSWCQKIYGENREYVYTWRLASIDIRKI